MLSVENYTFQLDGFEGPLDLLLKLIERRQLDITTISLALVTDQYLSHLDAVRQREPESLSAFLVVAAKLLLIKSIALLPSTHRRQMVEEDVEDPTDLTARILQYQRFRAAAVRFGELAEPSRQQYRRPLVPYMPVPTEPPREDPFALRNAFLNVLRQQKSSTPSETIQVDTFSVSDGLALIERMLGELRSMPFSRLGLVEPRRIVATFLALLELVRVGRVDARQEGLFGEIDLAVGDGSGQPVIADL